MTFRVLQSHRWKDDSTDKGKAYLASVGVTGEHEINQMTFGMSRDHISEVGLMRHQEDGAIRCVWYGQVEVGMTGARIVYTCQPEAGTTPYDGKVAVDQERCSVVGESLCDQRCVEGDVVIAQAAVAQGSGKGADYLRAAMNGVIAGDEGDRTVRDEVSGEQDQIGVELVDLVDDALEEQGFGKLVEVNVADLHNAISMEWRGQL